MKKFLLLLFAMFSLTAVQAEYNGFFIEMQIEKKDGSIQSAYVYRAKAYLVVDSLSQSNYLLKLLNTFDGNRSDTALFSSMLLSYQVPDLGYNHSYTIRTLANQTKLPVSQIKSISFVKKISQSYLVGLNFLGPLDDLSWSKKPLQDTAFVGGYLCSWDIYIHEKSPETNAIIQDLRDSYKSYRLQMDTIADSYVKTSETTDGWRRISEDEIEEIEYGIDAKMDAIIAKLTGKIVLITTCTC